MYEISCSKSKVVIDQKSNFYNIYNIFVLIFNLQYKMYILYIQSCQLINPNSGINQC